jgi:hypothetical protein
MTDRFRKKVPPPKVVGDIGLVGGMYEQRHPRYARPTEFGL